MVIGIVNQDAEHNAAKKLMGIAERVGTLPLQQLHQLQVACPWFAITPPNDPARRLAAELADTIAAFEKLRGTLVFEDEPASFEAALQATKETEA